MSTRILPQNNLLALAGGLEHWDSQHARQEIRIAGG